MKLLVDITHPAHYHFFKNLIHVWRERGDEVLIVARGKEIALELMDEEGFEYEVLSSQKSGIFGLAGELIVHEFKLYGRINKFKPDFLLQ